VALHLALSDAVEFRLMDLLPELRLELLASLFIQLRSGWLVLRELPPIVRDLFGKGLYDPMELIALEALLERKYSEPLPKRNANKGHITGIPPPTSTGQATQNTA